MTVMCRPIDPSRGDRPLCLSGRAEHARGGGGDRRRAARAGSHGGLPPRGWACALLSVALLAIVSRAAADTATPGTEHTPVEIQTSVAPKTVTIGTPFRYTMRITADKDIELIVPQLAGQIGDFEVTDFGAAPPREEKGRVVLDRWFTLVTYKPGDAIVPGPTVQYRVAGSDLQNVAAPDALITVQSLLDRPGPTPADVRDIKGPVAVPKDYRPLLWIAAAVVAAVALAAGLYHLLNRRRRNVPVAPPRPAHEIALEALAKLHAARLLEAGRHEEFYVRLSDIVRTYLELRFHLRAPEMTTEEFLQAAQRDPQLAPPQRSALATFLSEADLVKFARHVPALDDAERAYRAGRDFVQATAALEVSRAVA
jgi:hypothetical protein